MPQTYKFEPGRQLDYQLKASFEGYLPVLGGQEGRVDVTMQVAVKGLEPIGQSLRASSDITSFKIIFNGSPLPLTLESVKAYFPKTTVELSPLGKVLKSDAPDKQLPVRLPGLDVKRFPELTYLPLELPEIELAPEVAWDFKRSFAGADVTYRCKVLSVAGDDVKIDLQFEQQYDTFENSAKEVVASAADAAASVSTKLKGSGQVVFDRKAGVVRTVDLKAVAESRVKDLATKEESDRKLTTGLQTTLRKK